MTKSATYLSMLCLAFAMPASAGVLYSNGPVNATVTGWTINFDFVVSDSFTLSSPGTVTGFSFASWNIPGTPITAVDWSIGSASFGADLGSGTATPVSSTFQFNNIAGFDIFSNTVSGLNLSLGAGTYWLSLQNANAGGNPAYWDENDGPSQAVENQVGAIGSQTFDINGDASSVPEPGSVGLLGAGLVAMAGILRRKIAKS